MSDRKLFRSAISHGLTEVGLVRAGTRWTHDAGLLQWVASVDNRYWAGLAVEASLFIGHASGENRSLILVLFLETLPMAQSLEMKQALYLSSNLADGVRHDRLVRIAMEFGELLRSLETPAALRQAKAEGRLQSGWISPDFEELVGR